MQVGEMSGAVPGFVRAGRPRWKPSSCGRDARAPRKPSSHDIVTPRAQDCRSIVVPLAERLPVVCMDETNKQLIQEVREKLPAEPGQPERWEHE